MNNIDWSSNGEKARDADVARLDRGTGRPAALDEEGLRRRRLRQRREAWLSNLSFVALWILASRFSGGFFSNSAMDVLVGFWIAVNGTIVVNAIVVASRDGWL